MASSLIIAPVENLQEKTIKVIENFKGIAGIYISLSRPSDKVKENLINRKIQIDKLFFIDCVSLEQANPEVFYISPDQLDKLTYAIDCFIKTIPGKKFLVIDALSTLILYNPENKVAAFTKKITNYSSKKDVDVVAISPKTKGEELLNKIFNFFDTVKRDENEAAKNGEALIY